MKWLSLFFLFIGGCENLTLEEKVNSFSGVHHAIFMATSNVEILNHSYVNSHQFISVPVNTWQAILKLKYRNSQTFSYSFACLLYRVPAKKRLGKLKIVQVDSSKECSDTLFHNSSGDHGEISSIKSLKVYLTNHKKMLLRNNRKIPPYHLVLLLETGGGKFKEIKFPLYNVRREGNARDFKRFASSVIQRKIPGMQIFSLSYSAAKKIDNNLVKEKKLIPTLCHSFDKNCNEVQKFQCQKCQNGWYELAGNSCPLANDKHCGISNCGKKNMPACPRGSAYLRERQGTIAPCSANSPQGFCQEDLITACLKKRHLICI